MIAFHYQKAICVYDKYAWLFNSWHSAVSTQYDNPSASTWLVTISFRVKHFIACNNTALPAYTNQQFSSKVYSIRIAWLWSSFVFMYSATLTPPTPLLLVRDCTNMSVILLINQNQNPNHLNTKTDDNRIIMGSNRAYMDISCCVKLMRCYVCLIIELFIVVCAV